jgi:hypothetical protein
VASSNTLALGVKAQIKQSPSSSSLSALQQQQDFVVVNSDESRNNNNQESNSLKPKDTTHAAATTHQAATNEEEIHLNKLRQLLGAGQKTNAIDLAIKHNMWPHALFLASSFNNTSISNTTSIIPSSSSTLNSQSSNSSAAVAASQANEPKLLNKVKMRFINSLQPNDPIHTCYQLLIGRVPSVASVGRCLFYIRLYAKMVAHC